MFHLVNRKSPGNKGFSPYPADHSFCNILVIVRYFRLHFLDHTQSLWSRFLRYYWLFGLQYIFQNWKLPCTMNFVFHGYLMRTFGPAKLINLPVGACIRKRKRKGSMFEWQILFKKCTFRMMTSWARSLSKIEEIRVQKYTVQTCTTHGLYYLPGATTYPVSSKPSGSIFRKGQFNIYWIKTLTGHWWYSVSGLNRAACG